MTIQCRGLDTGVNFEESTHIGLCLKNMFWGITNPMNQNLLQTNLRLTNLFIYSTWFSVSLFNNNVPFCASCPLYERHLHGPFFFIFADTGLSNSKLIDKFFISYFIPFLPLERKHVRKCVIKTLQERIGKSFDTDLVDDVMDELSFRDPDENFSLKGCKNVDEKVNYILGGRTFERREELWTYFKDFKLGVHWPFQLLIQ